MSPVLNKNPRVWLGDCLAECPPDAPAWFSPPECVRWDGLGESRKRPFLGSRILLRGLLADELGRRPADWALDGRGRPLTLIGEPGAGLRTSISHHRERAAVALCCGSGGLGIDLERPRRGCRWASIARRWFTPAEQALLAACEPAQGERLFYRFWTLKEAWVKATGQGLAGNFQAIRAVAGEGARWWIEADTRKDDWQAWSGWVGPDCLAVVWQGGAASAPRIENIALDTTACSRVESVLAEDAWRVDIEPVLRKASFGEGEPLG
jgi:4'-phosphopantetheinyl transferase